MITNQFCLHFDTNFHRKFTQCDKISIQLFTENSITKTKHPFNYSQKIQSLKQNIHPIIHKKINQWKFEMRTRMGNENQQKQIT
jgi:hypothetical protein